MHFDQIAADVVVFNRIGSHLDTIHQPAELDAAEDPRVRQFVRGEAGERLMEMREAGAVEGT